MWFSNLFRSKRHVTFQSVVVTKKFSKNDAPVKVAYTQPVPVVVSPENDFTYQGGRKKRLRKSPVARKRIL